MNSKTPSQKVWSRLKRNKLAFCGLIFIVVLMFIGLLGYLIIPDDTPYANRQQLQISKEKPGSTFTFLIINHFDDVERVNIFQKMLYGQPAIFKSIPITAYQFSEDKVLVKEYIGTDEQATTTSYNLVDLCKPCMVPNSTAEKQELFIRNNIYEQTYYLGTDIYGRDLLSRLVLGIRVSLSVGLMAVIISLFIGIGLGALAGYFGGKVDASISWFMNVIWSLPSLLLVIALSFALGKGFWQIFIAVGLSCSFS
jgi:oligopeptide transport system permease protein